MFDWFSNSYGWALIVWYKIFKVVWLLLGTLKYFKTYTLFLNSCYLEICSQASLLSFGIAIRWWNGCHVCTSAFSFCLLFFISCICVWVVTAHVWISGYFFNHLFYGYWNQVVEFCSKCLDLLSYIADPSKILYFSAVCICVIVVVWAHMLQWICGGQRTILWEQFSPSTSRNETELTRHAEERPLPLTHLINPILFFWILEKSSGPVWLTTLLLCGVCCSTLSAHFNKYFFIFSFS